MALCHSTLPQEKQTAINQVFAGSIACMFAEVKDLASLHKKGAAIQPREPQGLYARDFENGVYAQRVAIDMQTLLCQN